MSSNMLDHKKNIQGKTVEKAKKIGDCREIEDMI